MLAGAKHCFDEEIFPDSPVHVSYTIIDGAGDLPVTLQVKHVETDSLIYARDNIDNAKFTFHTVGGGRTSFAEDNHQALPRDKKVDWRVQNEAGEEVVGAIGAHSDSRSVPPSHTAKTSHGNPQVPPTAGSAISSAERRSRNLYSFCFGKSLSPGAGLFHIFPHVPHLPGGQQNVQQHRRVIFKLRTGPAAQTRTEVELLAKELHLSESDKLFVDVYSHVSEVIKQIDSMRLQAAETDSLHETTATLVTIYSILACVGIVVGACAAAWGTQATLKQRKMI